MNFAHVAILFLAVFGVVAPSASHAQLSQPFLLHKVSRLTWGSSIDDKRVQIYIDISPKVQRLHVVIDGVEVPDKDGQLAWKISSGLPGYTSPVGPFSLDNRWRMAYSRKYNNTPMPFAQFFSAGKVGIHGTTAVGQLGRVASHGCIRLHTKNAERLFKLVEAVLVHDCSLAGIDPAMCPLTDNRFKANPSQNVGVVLYDSRNNDTMYGMSTDLPWLSNRSLAPAPRVIAPPAPSREEIDRALEEDRAFEEEDRRRTQELNRQMNEQYIRQRQQSYNSPQI